MLNLLASETTARKKIGRIGKNHVDGVFFHLRQNIETVRLKKRKVRFFEVRLDHFNFILTGILNLLAQA